MSVWRHSNATTKSIDDILSLDSKTIYRFGENRESEFHLSFAKWAFSRAFRQSFASHSPKRVIFSMSFYDTRFEMTCHSWKIHSRNLMGIRSFWILNNVSFNKTGIFYGKKLSSAIRRIVFDVFSLFGSFFPHQSSVSAIENNKWKTSLSLSLNLANGMYLKLFPNETFYFSSQRRKLFPPFVQELMKYVSHTAFFFLRRWIFLCTLARDTHLVSVLKHTYVHFNPIKWLL